MVKVRTTPASEPGAGTVPPTSSGGTPDLPAGTPPKPPAKPPTGTSPGTGTAEAPRSIRRLILLLGVLVILLTVVISTVVLPNWKASRALAQAKQLLERNDLQPALDQLQIADAARPDHAETLYLLSQTFRRLERIPASVEAREKARKLGWIPELIQMEDELQRLLERGPDDATMKRMLAYVEVDHPEKRVILDGLARSLSNAVYLNEASIVLTRWTTLFPDDWLAYRLRGELSESFGDLDKALEDYRKSAEVRPDRVESQIRLAVTLARRREDFALAKELLDAASKSDPTNAELLEGLARCAWNDGNSDQARAFLDRLQATHPDHVPGYLLRATIDLADNLPNESLKSLKLVQARLPNQRELLYLLSQTYDRLNQPTEAKRYADRVQEIESANREILTLIKQLSEKPADAPLRFRIGELGMKTGQLDQAVSWYQSALAADPNYKPAQEALAAYFQTHVLGGAAPQAGAMLGQPGTRPQPGPQPGMPSPTGPVPPATNPKPPLVGPPAPPRS
ncbi:tetratricopeptide repeat protein [Tuwongella immobilis]|uniref:Uncharacterized protein n=1 Tax=Tuwongella immobilis TaxID=692036 RepID=A0A6C2YVU6_9BACT|nr:tetratricopeptide repeat protein [Tuwongella immobilis]VIP05636.1 tpr tetratricopeptide repeat : TPR repeat OS=Planctomyces maris DSM 8797 GN=PM8797T_22083 PE=4 SV=1: TPR_1: TPR_19: TPR_8: TPR_8 [Tuwongella immobilis]VTS08628.1 tpr tetratricopeptide repeat : TPR repeat OS=Planctomyces maris DSM 8797 GN=PM8797T_22083 PE=4 SV=1: TPR_1: TPR_19: TPR_8: TPR_8 [Tuwongella immobilis]